MSRSWSFLLLAGLLGVLPARCLAGEEGAVLVGEREMLRLRAAGPGGLSPAERAAIATRRIAAALADPDIGPEDIHVAPRGQSVDVRAGRMVLFEVQAEDAGVEGSTARELGERWAGLLRLHFAETKGRDFTLTLLMKYLVALTYPLILAVALLGISRLRRRGLVWILRLDDAGTSPLSFGRFELVSMGTSKFLMRTAFSVFSWAVALAAILVFLLATFYYFPATRGTALTVLAGVGGIVRAIGAGMLETLLRLVMILAVWGGCSAVVRAWGRFFDQVEAGRVRLAPYVTVENADTLEFLSKSLTFLLAAILTVLLLPGEQGQLAKGVLLLVGLALALSSVNILRHAMAGFMLAFLDTHRRGGLLELDGREVMIVRRGLLVSTVRHADGRSMTIPNERLLSTPVIGRRPADLVAWSVRIAVPGDVPLAGLQQRLEQWAKESGPESQVSITGVHGDEVSFDALVPYLQASSEVFLAVACDGLKSALAEGNCRLVDFSLKRSKT